MRRIRSGHLDDKPVTPFRPPGEISGDIGKQLAAVLAGLDDIADVQKTLKEIGNRLSKLEAMVNETALYEKHHTELHRNMAADATSLKKEVVVIAAATQQQTTQAMTSHMQITSDAIGMMQRAIEEFTHKKIEVKVDVPEVQQTSTIVQGNKIYKLKRHPNNLIDEIHERDA